MVLVPWLITDWHEGKPVYPIAVRVIGVILLAIGGVVQLAPFVWFVVEGTGIPFPTNPPSSRKVMVGGPYRYVRNPMYVGYFIAIIGLALLLSRLVLLIYAAVLLVALMAFVHWWEEPTLIKRFGQEYEAYRHQVPGWWPRLHERGT
jgi:protein-S-isoprenylcysteine O-methyltransferase Ste14